MNNDQIVDYVSSGVFKAVASALGFFNNNGGNWTIQLVDIDGRIKSSTIITAAERRNRRDGKTIIPIGI